MKNKNPEIFEPIKLRGVNINSIQSKLYENQAVLDYYFSQNELAIVIIKKNSLKVHFDNINTLARQKYSQKKTISQWRCFQQINCLFSYRKNNNKRLKD